MSQKNDIDHEVRNSIVKLRAQIHRIEKVVREIEKDLADFDKRMEALELAIQITISSSH